LSINSNAIQILEKNIEKINWTMLSYNFNAIHILEKNMDKVDWTTLSRNINAIQILERNIEKVNWVTLSCNFNAIHILEKNMDKVNWENLSGNDDAIRLIELNLCKINWKNISLNTNALHILEKNIDKIHWSEIFVNHGIFELDLKFIKTRMDLIREELMMKIFSPKRVDKYLKMDYNICNDEYLDNDESYEINKLKKYHQIEISNLKIKYEKYIDDLIQQNFQIHTQYFNSIMMTYCQRKSIADYK
jgi:hypothetical protein